MNNVIIGFTWTTELVLSIIAMFDAIADELILVTTRFALRQTLALAVDYWSRA